MNKDTQILLIALVIIMVGAISFNYMNITGKIIKTDTTSMIISPKAVKAGDFIYINIQPGKQGVYQKVEFYRADKDMKYSGQSANVCSSSKCFEKNLVKFKIMSGWDDNSKWGMTETTRDYYARVYDIYSGKYVRSYFTVERSQGAAGPEEHR